MPGNFKTIEGCWCTIEEKIQTIDDQGARAGFSGRWGTLLVKVSVAGGGTDTFSA